MRVLLDENIPHDLIAALVRHDVATVQGLGWAGGQVDAFVTMDRKLERQHDLSAVPFGVVVIAAQSSRVQDLLPLVGAMLAALDTLAPGTVIRVGA